MTTFSIAAMGVYPYITASIIVQLLTPIIPSWAELSKEGDAGRKRLNQYTHWLTVPLAAMQAYATAQTLLGQSIIGGFGLSGETLLPTISIIVSMTAGTILFVWLGELITENGIGNGVSIVIFAGIIAKLPSLGQGILAGTVNPLAVIIFAVLGLGTIFAIVVVQEAQRRIPVQYAKRIRGNKMYGGQSTHIPLRVNSAGMIPLIFAMSIMLLPGTLASYFVAPVGTTDPSIIQNIAQFIYNMFNANSFWYWLFYFILVVGFTFFYAIVLFQQQNLADNLQKYGGFIPGIRPGRPTAEYLNKVLNRITWIGALFLGIIAVLPFFAQGVSASLPLSSTGLLIVVGVVLDTMKQLEAQLLMRHYEGFIK
jgi:preprotein translocase subunit SecY